MGYVFYPIEGDTLIVPWDTFDGGTGASITQSGLAVTDIEIYKDASMTQRASDAGYTLLDTDGIDLDGVTGIQGISIDLSDDTDSGFYGVGPWYRVVISAVTVDGQTVNFTACMFRIVGAERGMAGTALPAAAADGAGGLPISDAGGLDLDAILADTADIQPKLGTISDLGSGATIGANLTDIEGETDDIGAAGAGLSAVPWNASWDAEVQSEVTDALNAYDPPTRTEATSDKDEILAILGTPSGADLAADVAANLTAINALNDPTAASIADAVWNEAATDHVTFGSFGQVLGAGRVAGRVNDASATTTDFDTDGFTEASDDHFNRHLLVFTSGNLLGQGRPIYNYTGSGQNVAFDRAFTEAPANNDEFVILDIFDPAVDIWLARAADVESNATVLNSRAAWWAAAKLINRADADTTPGTLTIYEDDDTTSLFSQTLTSDASADPVTQANTD